MSNQKKEQERERARQGMERLRMDRTEEEKREEKEKNKMRKRRARAAKMVMEREMQGKEEESAKCETFATKVQMEMERKAKELEEEEALREKQYEEYIKRGKEEFDTWRPVVYTCPSGLKGPQLGIVSKKEWSDTTISRVSIKVWSIFFLTYTLWLRAHSFLLEQPRCL